MSDAQMDPIETPEHSELLIGGLSLWVLGYQFPNLSDYWDGNWLIIKALVVAPGSRVEVRGPLIHGSEWLSFERQLAELNRNLNGKAHLKCMEPNLDLLLECDSHGHVEATISITPEHMTQRHKFIYSLDQTYLDSVLKRTRQILAAYPIRGKPSEK